MSKAVRKEPQKGVIASARSTLSSSEARCCSVGSVTGAGEFQK